jgi:hypothetical protein
VKFTVKVEVVVADKDINVLRQMPVAIKDRFEGTAILIEAVSIWPADPITSDVIRRWNEEL